MKELEDALQEAQAEKLALEGRAAESEAALKACMGRVADLEARVASAPESLSPKVGIHCSLCAPALYTAVSLSSLFCCLHLHPVAD